MNDMDMSYLAALLTRGAQATSSIKRTSSQRYMPHYPVIRIEAPCRAPCQRRGRRSSARAVGVSQGLTTGRENRR
jgi:hypothetical protein